jgi:hypothetical protein
MDKIQIILIVFSLAFILFILELTRKRKIREQYSLIWFLIGFVMLLFSVFRGLLDVIAAFLGIYYAPSLILTIALLLGLISGIHFSIVISKLTETSKTAIQEIGILKNKIEEMEKRAGTSKEGADGQ